MQTTKIIGNIDLFKNKLTKYGRNKNYLIKELKARGFSEFRERTLKDKSQVLLAYEKGKNLAEYAFRLFPDLSIEQKRSNTGHALFNLPVRIRNISKIFIDKTGNTVKEHLKRIRYACNEFSEKTERINNYVNGTLTVKEELVRGYNDYSLGLKGIVKSYSRLKNDDTYSFYKLANGTKHYIKKIGDIEYKFSSK